MRSIKSLFSVPNNEKVTNQHRMRVLISTVCSIVLCLSCLVSTTWAWYQATVISQNNVLTIGQWTDLTQQITEETEETTVPQETTEATEETTAETTEETTEATTAPVEETTAPTTEADELDA